MKKIIRKWTASWAAIAFTWMLIGIISPDQLNAGTAKAEIAASTVEAAKSENTENNSFEKEATTPEIAKKKKSPWPYIIAGALVVGIVVYFTLIKKPKYDLTVEVGAGVTGTPIAGKHTYKKGKQIAYSFASADGYKNLTVLLDGENAATSGTIVMDKAHTLGATVTKMAEYTLTVNTDSGITGSPAAGTYQYREGSTVSYQYSAIDRALSVSLDDISVPLSGSFVMDMNHVLKAQKAFTLTIKIENGITGTPTAGTDQIQKGTIVFYKYTAGGSLLSVKLDDKSMPSFGSFMMDKDHILKVSFVDIRGEWRFILKDDSDTQAKPQLLLSFSGTKTNGDVRGDPNNSYWSDFGGRCGDYQVSSNLVSLFIDGYTYYVLNGEFESSNSISGSYTRWEADPDYIIGRGIWTATRIE